MRQFTSDELRKAWKQFYIDRGHVDVGAVSLVSDGSTGVMFNVGGHAASDGLICWGRSILWVPDSAMCRAAFVPTISIP